MSAPKRTTSSRASRSKTLGRSVRSSGREVSQWIASHGWDRDFEVRELRGRVVFSMRGSEKEAAKALRDLRALVRKARQENGQSIGERLARAGVLGSVDSGIGDLATNKAHMKGFGRD